MRRSQTQDTKPPGGPSSIRKKEADKKKIYLEQAYGASVPKAKPPIKGSTSVLKKGTTSSVVPGSGSNKSQLGVPASSSNLARPRQSSIVAASKASYTEKYGSPLQKRPTQKSQQPNATTTQKSQQPNTTGSRTANGRNAVKTVNSVGSSQSVKSTKMNNSSVQQKQGQTLKKPEPKIIVPDDEVDYDDDDFEEDYQSDFEEVESTDSEEHDPIDEVLSAGTSIAHGKESQSERDESVQDINFNRTQSETSHKSNLSLTETEDSVAEFERLEKQVKHNGQDLNEGSEDDDDSININQRKDDSKSGLGFFSQSNQKDTSKIGNARGQAKGISGLDTRKIQVENPKKQQLINEEVSKGAREASGIKSTANAHKENSKSKAGLDFERSSVELHKKGKMTRGRQLQSMIKLNKVSADLLHLAPSLEQFLYASGGTRRLQSYSQVENDNADESCQTDELEMSSKWTQKPPTWSSASYNADLRVVRQEAIGVGSETFDDKDNNKPQQFDFLKNWQKLCGFINRASRKVLYVLESEKRLSLPENGNKGAEIQMNRGLSILNKLEMGCLTCEGDFLACANGQSVKVKGKKRHTSKNIITMWSLKEPSNPIYFLRAWGLVSCIKIYPLGHLVVSGNKEGTVSVWDLDESSQYHTQYQESVIRTPSVTTSCMDPTHLDSVVGLAVLPEAKDTSLILSIDKSGKLMIWVCIRTKEPVADLSYTQHSSAWSKIHLSVRHITKLDEILKEPVGITAFHAWKDEEHIEFAISTLNGFTARGLFTEEKTVFQKYAETLDKDPSVMCFDLSTDINVLLTGCRDGRCRLYEFGKRKMILSVDCKGFPLSVKWSKLRSSVFYVALPKSILIWDLLVSDVTPAKKVPITNVQGFGIYSTPQKEFTVVMASNDLKISSLAGDLKLLTSKDQQRLQSFVALLVVS